MPLMDRVKTFLGRKKKNRKPSTSHAPPNGAPANGTPANGTPANGTPANGIPGPHTEQSQIDTKTDQHTTPVGATKETAPRKHPVNPKPSPRPKTSPGYQALRARFVTPQSLGIPDLKPCFTEDLLLDIINQETVISALPNAEDNLISFALSAYQVFAILIQIINDEEVMIETLKSFQHHGFLNESLPIINMGNCCDIFGEDYCKLGNCSINNSSCIHDSELDVFHHYPWDPTLRGQFYDHQWKVHIDFLTLDLDKCKTECEKDRILPVIKLNGSQIQGSGHFSELYKGQILRTLQKTVQENDEWVDIIIKLIENQKEGCVIEQAWITIVIKQLKNRNDYIVHEEWIREIEALSTFNKLNHHHIVRGIAACRQSERHYIFLEWADGDNLRKLWARNPRPELNPKTVQEFLWQLLGLTDALYHMHRDSDVHEVLNQSGTFVLGHSNPLTRSSSRVGSSLSSHRQSREDPLPAEALNCAKSAAENENSSTAPPLSAGDKTPKLPQATAGSKNTNPSVPDIVYDLAAENKTTPKSSNWRHGDIKPENILVFKNDSSLLGTLKLGDLGRAKKHDFSTVSPRRRATGEGYGTQEYEPPEASLSKSKARSRTYDIWSMGCIIFEAIYWLLYGIEEKNAQENRTTSETPQGTRYWVPDPLCIREPKAKVNPITARTINNMLEKELKRETALRHLLLLVRDHLLVVHMPGRLGEVPILGNDYKLRKTAEFMLEKLTNIVERAEKEPAYLFTEADRMAMQVPLLTEDQVERPQAPVDTSTIPQFPGALDVAPNKLNSYSHQERDVWEFHDDDHFANGFITNNKLNLERLQPQADSKICNVCSARNFESLPFKFNHSVLELDERSKEGCELCSLLLETTQRAGIEDTDTAYFEYSESTIRLQWGEAPLALSICHTSSAPMARIRRALPCVATPESPAQFAIMRSWIAHCNSNNRHATCQRPAITFDTCPKRLIQVGSVESNRIYIVEKPDLADKLKHAAFHYIAFSHPWGDKENHKHFTSTTANIAAHKSEGILIADLPNTFQAAIRITQQMDVGYLWIDSLCILQGSDGDFGSESRKMEHIYSSAYLTISASSAVGTASLPLGPRPHSVMKGENAGVDHIGNRVIGERKVVKLRSKDKRPIFVAQSLDNFKADVLESPLSQRGWVFQERALSRRTIYLTGSQVYWECGQGIRCETLTKLQNPMVRFLGDPNFPDIAAKLNRGGQIYYYERLYEQYSKLKFTFKEDRSVAIYGLEARVCRALNDIGGYGLFKKNLGRGLLWRRSGTNPLESIVFSHTSHRGRPAPSWSWMSYVGGIEYISPVGGSLVWNQGISWVLEGNEVTLTLKCSVRDLERLSEIGETDANIDMDDATELRDESLRCIVVGKEKLYHDNKKKKHYVLIVQEASRTRDAIVYNRKGVGWILGSFIGRDEKEAFIE